MKRVNNILLLLGLGFLAYLLWKSGLTQLWKQITALGWGILLIVIAEGLANLAHTLGWRHCIRNVSGRIPLWGLFRMNMAGFAINYLTPTASVGGELSRATLLAETHKGAEAASSVLLDKLMTAIAHLLLVVLGAVFLFWRLTLPPKLWAVMGVSTVLLTTGLVIFLLLQKHGKLGAFCRRLAQTRFGGSAAKQAAERISRVDDALKQFFREHSRDLVLSVGWHFIGHSAAIVQAWLFLYLLGQPASFPTVAAAGLLSLWFDLITFAIPMNLGTLEGSRIVVLKSLGCQALLGMTFGITIRIAQLSWAVFGLVSYALQTASGDGKRSALGRDQSNESPSTLMKSVHRKARNWEDAKTAE